MNEGKKKSRNRPTSMWLIDSWQGYKRHSVEEGESFQQMVLKRRDIRQHAPYKNKKHEPHTLKSYLKVTINLNVTCRIRKHSEGNIQNLWDLKLDKRFFGHDTKKSITHKMISGLAEFKIFAVTGK